MLTVLWRLRYKLSLRDLAEMCLVRGFAFFHEAGVVAAPVCVSSPFGGLGYHAMHFAKDQQQWAGVMDINDPPILLLDANRRVVGLE
jgi:hypothetical protein